MKDFQKKIQKLRPDLSNWLFHFAKGKPDEAKATIQSILKNGLRDFGRGLCFTESPLIGFSRMFEIFSAYPKPMYAPYGIAVRKDWFFERGGRPVIYLPPLEKKYLSKDIEHLFEKYKPGINDFTWLREWRLKHPCLPLTREDTFVIVPSEQDAVDCMLLERGAEGEYEGPDEYSVSEYLEYHWHYIILEEIKSSQDETSDTFIQKALDFQGRDDE
jgi:hypothetical protein